MIQNVDLVIIGAGPAGIEAAITASEAGLSTLVFDGYPKPGGQYFKQFPTEFYAERITDTMRKGNNRIVRLINSSARLFSNAEVWGISRDNEKEEWNITIFGEKAPKQVTAQSLIVASGAYDYPLAFPGWTLPGVMTAGAGQILIKNQRILPGERVLLSGSGPLQIALASQLIHAGAEVVALLEASKKIGDAGLKHFSGIWGQWDRMGEGLDYMFTLTKAGISIKTGWSIVEARGNDQVTEALIAPLDDKWNPILSSKQTLRVDAVICGFGLVPNAGISRMVGCEHEYAAGKGGWVPKRDDRLCTTLKDLYVVGDAAGIGGAELAMLEGKFAALQVALDHKKMSFSQVVEASAKLVPAIKKQRRFAEFLGSAFCPGIGLPNLAQDDTFICPCEEVTLKEVKQAVRQGACSVTEVKMVARPGLEIARGGFVNLYSAIHSTKSYPQKKETWTR